MSEKQQIIENYQRMHNLIHNQLGHLVDNSNCSDSDKQEMQILCGQTKKLIVYAIAKAGKNNFNKLFLNRIQLLFEQIVEILKITI